MYAGVMVLEARFELAFDELSVYINLLKQVLCLYQLGDYPKYILTVSLLVKVNQMNNFYGAFI